MSAIALTVTKPPVRPGDIVLHLRNARRMQRGMYCVDWLVPKGMALA